MSYLPSQVSIFSNVKQSYKSSCYWQFFLFDLKQQHISICFKSAIAYSSIVKRYCLAVTILFSSYFYAISIHFWIISDKCLIQTISFYMSSYHWQEGPGLCNKIVLWNSTTNVFVWVLLSVFFCQSLTTTTTQTTKQPKLYLELGKCLETTINPPTTYHHHTISKLCEWVRIELYLENKSC